MRIPISRSAPAPKKSSPQTSVKASRVEDERSLARFKGRCESDKRADAHRDDQYRKWLEDSMPLAPQEVPNKEKVESGRYASQIRKTFADPRTHVPTTPIRPRAQTGTALHQPGAPKYQPAGTTRYSATKIQQLRSRKTTALRDALHLEKELRGKLGTAIATKDIARIAHAHRRLAVASRNRVLLQRN